MRRDVAATCAIGATYALLRASCATRTPLHPLVAQQTELVAWNYGLCAALSSLTEFVEESTMARLLAVVNDVRRHDERRDRTSSHYLSCEIRNLEGMLDDCARVQSSMTADKLRQNTYMAKDVLPLIKSTCATILHNHLLRDMI